MTTHQNTHPTLPPAALEASRTQSAGGAAGAVSPPAPVTLSLTECNAIRHETNPEGVE